MHQPILRPVPFECSVQTHDNYMNWKRPSTTSISKPSLPCSGGRDGLRTPPADEMSAGIPSHWAYVQNKITNSTNQAPLNMHTSNDTYTRPLTTVNLPPLDAGMNTKDERQRFQAGQCWDQQLSKISHNRSISDDQMRRKSVATLGDSNQIKLQIPSTISLDGGSLSDFAAQITCLFWFESIEILNEAEGLVPSSVRSIRPEAIPSGGFRKWICTILSTTQVSENVVILALLFIYRLKKYNPTVKGRSGSEYRLLTVALMLGNKFLDDNTYTNSTWAEVSGISVQEIHVMEVEFLSNMRYSLVASSEQWKEWQQKLGMFKLHCDVAIRGPVVPYPLPPMPSPPESTHSSPPLNIRYTHLEQNRRPWPVLGLHSSTSLQSPSYYARKRSLDIDAGESAAKKALMTNGRRINNIPHRLKTVTQNDPTYLPPISTNQIETAAVNTAVNSGSKNLILPPLGTLPPTSSRLTPDIFSSNPNTPSWSSPFLFPTPRQMSPQTNSSVMDIWSLNSSPVSASHSSHGHISPSIFLQQRSSPYNPVRHVNTLLYPPPFGPIHDNPINVQEMRYRILGKGNENLRTGVVPQWPTSLQSHHHL